MAAGAPIMLMGASTIAKSASIRMSRIASIAGR